MFHVEVSKDELERMAVEVASDFNKAPDSYRDTQVAESDREFLRETYVKYSHTVRTPGHLNRKEVQQLKQLIGEAMRLRYEKLRADQFHHGGQRYVIVSAYLYAEELYAI